MKGCSERTVASEYSFKSSSDSENRNQCSTGPEPGPSGKKFSKTSLWSGLASAFSKFDKHSESKGVGKKGNSSGRVHGWSTAVKRIMNVSSMRRIQERVLGLNKAELSISTSDIWLLGVCYKMHQEDSSADPAQSDRFAAFLEDFSSRIRTTYRRGMSDELLSLFGIIG